MGDANEFHIREFHSGSGFTVIKQWFYASRLQGGVELLSGLRHRF